MSREELFLCWRKRINGYVIMNLIWREGISSGPLAEALCLPRKLNANVFLFVFLAFLRITFRIFLEVKMEKLLILLLERIITSKKYGKG